jgi:hypothetical protein
MVLNKVRKIKSPLPMSDSIRLLFGAQFRTVAKSKNDLRQAQRVFFLIQKIRQKCKGKRCCSLHLDCVYLEVLNK